MRVGVLGAGAIGAFVGLRLSDAGAEVTLVGRPGRAPRRDALTVQTRSGERSRVGPRTMLADAPAALAGVDVCLVAVKSVDTEDAGRALARVLAPTTPVVSLQNGLRNRERLARHVPGPVSQGVVGFHVARSEDGLSLHQTSEGPLVVGRIEGDAARVLDALASVAAAAGLRMVVRKDVERVAAGKLLLNLNNGIGAATGLPIAATLASEDARRCFARCIGEGRSILRASGLRPGRVSGVPPAVFERGLELPDVLFRHFARRLRGMDPEACSSTLVDLRRGRPTEIDDLNGEIVRRAAEVGRAAPANATVVEIVRAHERRARRGEPPRFLAPRALLATMQTSPSLP